MSQSQPSIQLYYHSLAQPLPSDYYQHHLALLPVVMQQKLNKLHRWQDQHASLLGKIMLLKALKTLAPHLSLANLSLTPHGRPYFPNASFDFNISHANNLVMCGVSPTRIGVDVEQVLPISLSDFESHFTPEEFLHMQEAPNPLLAFYTHWTQKEAVLKAMGTGLSVPLIDITLKDKLAYYQQNPWNVHSGQLPDGSVYAVAFQGDGVVELEGVGL